MVQDLSEMVPKKAPARVLLCPYREYIQSNLTSIDKTSNASPLGAEGCDWVVKLLSLWRYLYI